MFNFKNILIMLCIALVIYGVSLLIKLILTKTNKVKIWENYIGKYWTIFVLVVSSIVYIIIGACNKNTDYFINGLMNGILLTGMQASMFKIISFVKNLFTKK